MKGLKAVAEALRLEDFPMDRHAIDYAVGDMEVEDGHGGCISVRRLTDGFGEHEFRSAEEVVHALVETVRKKAKAA